jgi:predicted oxidoreductase
MQLIAGTMNPNRLDEIIDGSKITLTREEWYKIYLAAGNILP